MPKRPLDAMERAWLLATPLQEPATAGFIARRAGIGSGQQFGGFANKREDLFHRMGRANNSYVYRLSEAGAALKWKLEADAQP